MNKIEIHLEGGIIQDIQGLPDDVTVIIKDYDIEAYEEDELVEDKDGNEYKEIVF